MVYRDKKDNGDIANYFYFMEYSENFKFFRRRFSESSIIVCCCMKIILDIQCVRMYLFHIQITVVSL